MIDFQTILDNINDKNAQKKTILEWANEFHISEKSMQTFMQEHIDNGDVMLSKKGKVMHPHEFNVFKGVISINSRGHGYVHVEGLENDIFVSASYLSTAMHKDIVAVNLVEDHGHKHARVIKIIERATTQMVGTITQSKRGWDFFPVDVKMTLRYPIEVTSNIQVKTLDMVIAQIVSYQPLKFKVIEVLGSSKQIGMDIIAILVEHKINLEFSANTLVEAKQIVQTVNVESGRVDYRNAYVVTIDGEDAKDLDDAISIEKVGDEFRLHVHIADVSYYVKEGSALDSDAYKRGTSVYAANTVVPMLPVELSNGICSLHPDVDRFTITASLLISAQGQINDIQIHPSIIRSQRRLTYSFVNACIEDEAFLLEEDEQFNQFLRNALACSDALSYRKQRSGQLDFNTLESKFIMQEGKVVEVVARKTGRSEKIIEDFMVAANEAVAFTLRTMQLPGLYRVHEDPDPEKIEAIANLCAMHGVTLKVHQSGVHQTTLQKVLKAFEETPMFLAISTLMLRSMKKAVYSAQPKGHYGLALLDYTHFTSPIRRYPDLVVHRMLRKYIFEKAWSQQDYKQDFKNMELIAMQASITERKAMEAERAVEDMKKAEYMMNHLNEVFEGVISGITSFGFFVALPNSVEGLVHMSTLHDDYYTFDHTHMRLVGERKRKVYALGDTVKVCVVAANKDTRTIDFKVLKHGKLRHE